MKFTLLEITNFLTIGQATLQLDDRGLNVIQGVNDDDTSTNSNGAGKSSVVDALCWALYGATAREVKGDDVVNDTAKKNCRVSIIIENGATKYRITRHRKHKEFKNALHVHVMNPDGSSVDLSKGTDAETQKEVEKILGCAQDVFMAAIYAGQEMMPDLPKMTDRELKRLIEESAGLQRIEMAYEEARSRRNALNSSIEVAKNTLDTIKTRIARDEGALSLKTADRDEWNVGREARVRAAHEQHANATAKLTSAIEALLKQKEVHKAHLEERAELDAKLSEHSAIEGAARALERAATAAEVAIDRAAFANAKSVVETIAAQIENAAAELAKPCPECGKPHTEDELAEYIAHRTKRLEDAQANLALVKAKVQKQAMAAVAANKAAEEARAAVPDVSVITARRAALDRTITAYEFEKAALERLKMDVTAAASTVAMRESEVNPLEAVVEQLQKQIATDTAALAAQTERMAEMVKKQEVADAVVKVFGPAGVRAHILDTVTPFLNERTADYLSALSDGGIHATWSTLTKSAAGDLKEKFSIEVTNDKGGKSFRALSGGEKRKVRLATALALQDLVASRATQPIHLWIGDEIDDALDPAGLERLMTILERKARERGTVVVISHNELSDWCDSITTVRKSGGISTVEGSLAC